MTCAGPVPLRLVHLVLVVYVVSSCGPEVCNGEGSLFDSVGKFVVSVGDVMNSVSQGIEKVVEGVKTVENVLTDAIEEDCEYACTNGAKPRVNPYHRPTSNGCGSAGFQIAKHELPVKQLTHCCDDHDICYDTCNVEKDDCDKQFKKCLYRMCDKHVGQSKEPRLINSCKGAAKFMFVGTMALGCRPFKDAQEKACYCEKTAHDVEL